MILVCIYSPPPTLSKWVSETIFKRSLTDLNSEFSFILSSCNTKIKEPNLPNYGVSSWIHISINGLYWMQTASTKFWTRVNEFISYDHYR